MTNSLFYLPFIIVPLCIITTAILTTYNEEQARQRTAEKGAEAARVAIEMVRLGESLDAPHGDDGDDEE